MPHFALANLAPVLPEVVLAVGALVSVMIGAIGGEKSYALVRWVAILLMIAAGVLIFHADASNTAYFGIDDEFFAAGFDPALEEASADLGANAWQTFRFVTLPHMLPALAAGALIGFTLSLDDFVVTFFTSGPDSTTLPIKIYAMVRFSVTPAVNAASTVLIAVTALAAAALPLAGRVGSALAAPGPRGTVAGIALQSFLNYAFWAGLAWLLGYVLCRRRWAGRKIIPAYPAAADVRKMSIMSMAPSISARRAWTGRPSIVWPARPGLTGTTSKPLSIRYCMTK